MSLILIRHPETLHNQAKVFPDYTDVSYSLVGEDQLERVLAQDFRPDHIFSSPIDRALRMAELLGEKYQLKVTVDDRLREIDLGLFGGLQFNQVKERFPELMEEWMSDPWHFVYPEGEGYPQLKDRVLAFLNEIPKNSLICTHQAVCQIIAAQYGDERPMKTGEWRYYDHI